MSALKMAFTLTRNLTILTSNSSKFLHKRSTPLLENARMAIFNQSRLVCSQDITSHVQYISNDKVNLSRDPQTFKLAKPIYKPLCIMLNWMFAKQKHVLKYASIYLDQGFDVVSVTCTPWHLLWPVKGAQIVAGDVLKFLSSNESLDPMVVHGFSIGGYVWGEVLVHVAKDPAKHQRTMDRIVAQVWDSAVDVTEIPSGFPLAVFPKNPIMEKAFRKYLLYHLDKFHDVATVHYIRSSQTFHKTLVKAPALFLLSKIDPIGAEASNKSVQRDWESIGIETTWKCWDSSPHVLHYLTHPKEYIEALDSHLSRVGLISQPEKMRIRM